MKRMTEENKTYYKYDIMIEGKERRKRRGGI
jgi:hypothetical protein